MINLRNKIAVIGGGLAGCEAAWQVARSGFGVDLWEMRPLKNTPAHQTDDLAELVCSNSFKSMDPGNAHGGLKGLLLEGGSLLIKAAQKAQVPAGSALAVDKSLFSKFVEEGLESVQVNRINQEVTDLDPLLDRYDHLIVASGPLTSDFLAEHIANRLGESGLYFYDAIAPVVFLDSVDPSLVYRASRWDKGEADYLNCPFSQDQYLAWIEALLKAEKVGFKDFEQAKHFEGCLPIEVLAERGPETLAHGPLKPVGLLDPRSQKQAYAVLQLRQENRAGTLYNLVGCQTRMTWPEQKRVFRMVPGLEQAEFARLGSMHRNTFINSPKYLGPGLVLKSQPQMRFAGQITGAEGYTEAVATGFWAAFCLVAELRAQPIPVAPKNSLIGGLIGYLLGAATSNFQPMNANWGLVQSGPKPKKMGKAEFRVALSKQGAEAWGDLLRSHNWPS